MKALNRKDIMKADELNEAAAYLDRHGYGHCIEFGAVYVSDNRIRKTVRIESLRAAVCFVYGV